MKPCPICGELTEPELDGDVQYYECENEECEGGGYAFGHQRVGDQMSDCQLGVPEPVRRAGSMGGVPVEKTSTVSLGTTIGRRPVD